MSATNRFVGMLAIDVEICKVVGQKFRKPSNRLELIIHIIFWFSIQLIEFRIKKCNQKAYLQITEEKGNQILSKV